MRRQGHRCAHAGGSPEGPHGAAPACSCVQHSSRGSECAVLWLWLGLDTAAVATAGSRPACLHDPLDGRVLRVQRHAAPSAVKGVVVKACPAWRCCLSDATLRTMSSLTGGPELSPPGPSSFIMMRACPCATTPWRQTWRLPSGLWPAVPPRRRQPAAVPDMPRWWHRTGEAAAPARSRAPGCAPPTPPARAHTLLDQPADVHAGMQAGRRRAPVCA